MSDWFSNPAEAGRTAGKDREALYPWELSDAELGALQVAEPPAETDAFNHEYKSE